MTHSDARDGKSSGMNLFAILTVFVGTMLLLFATAQSQAQTFNVIHYFTGGSDGGNPAAGVTVGGPGLLYGTAQFSENNFGVVFKLTQRGSDWTLDPLHEFSGQPDGIEPLAGVVIGPNGALYGTTYSGGPFGHGGSSGSGTVFEVQPPATACKTSICYWNETIVHGFGDPGDGAFPQFGNVAFDQTGNIYGTTSSNSADSCGVVWELSPSGSGWTENVLYQFTDGSDGCNPYSGVIFDSAGNLYGVSPDAGFGAGALFQLMPSNGGWVEHSLVEFNGTTGIHPFGSLIKDAAGNFYGTARDNGPNGGGTVYELSPSDGGWSFSLVYAFSSCEPQAGVTLGPDGNLYGVCLQGGANRDGWVFQVPPTCNQTCTPNNLHDFNFSQGSYPEGPVAFDANGNLYGTAYDGGNVGRTCGSVGCGVVWEITP